MKEEAHPKIKGSRANSGNDPRGFASPTNRVSKKSAVVNNKNTSGILKLSMRVPVEETDTLIALHNLTPESSGVRLSKKYWAPDLTKKEWKLLDYKIDRVGEKLDQNTFWFYSNEKDVQVFCAMALEMAQRIHLCMRLEAKRQKKILRSFKSYWRVLQMKATEAQQLLIDGFKLFGVDKGMSVAIFMTLQTDEQMIEMCKYMAEHQNEAGQGLLEAARRISMV